MKLCSTALLLLFTLLLQAQDKDKQKDKKSVKEVIEELPDMLTAQPDAGVDTNANKLINDNLSLTINPMWREAGLLTLIEFKLQKTDKEPLSATFPIPDKNLTNGLIINLATAKKPAEEKKQQVLTQIKNHLVAYYKEAGITVSPQQLSDKLQELIISSESFTTTQGHTGQLYFINDIQTKQSNLVALLLIPAANPASTHFVQVNYVHYTYETTYPEDPLELKMFVYPDEQQAYIDFTMAILKTLKIR